jgi:hypothetical protein
MPAIKNLVVEKVDFSGAPTGSTNGDLLVYNAVDNDVERASTVPSYITDITTKSLLNDIANWDINGVYTGTAITGTFQGQNHYNADYKFEAVEDNLWIRLIRG